MHRHSVYPISCLHATPRINQSEVIGMDNREYINELLDRNFERIDRIAELEEQIEKLK